MIFTREKVKAKKKKKKVSAKPSLHLIFRMPVSDKLFYGRNSYGIKSDEMITMKPIPKFKTQKR